MQPIDLSDFFTTKVQADDFLSRLTTLSEMFFRTNFNFENALTQQLGVNKADKFLTIMRENNVNPASLSTVKEFVTVLTQRIMTMPVITLTVAFEPNDQALKSVSEWFVINMKKQLLFDIKIDQTIIAGATVTYQGKFSDFSIRETFNQILKKTLHDIEHPAQTNTQPVQQAPQTPLPTNNQNPHLTAAQTTHPAPIQPAAANKPQQTQSPVAVPTQQTKN
jgi:hypothetical protein